MGNGLSGSSRSELEVPAKHFGVGQCSLVFNSSQGVYRHLPHLPSHTVIKGHAVSGRRAGRMPGTTQGGQRRHCRELALSCWVSELRPAVRTQQKERLNGDVTCDLSQLRLQCLHWTKLQMMSLVTSRRQKTKRDVDSAGAQSGAQPGAQPGAG